MLVLRLRSLAFATFLVWRLRIGARGVGACGFWRLWQLPNNSIVDYFSMAISATGSYTQVILQGNSSLRSFPWALSYSVFCIEGGNF